MFPFLPKLTSLVSQKRGNVIRCKYYQCKLSSGLFSLQLCKVTRYCTKNAKLIILECMKEVEQLARKCTFGKV